VFTDCAIFYFRYLFLCNFSLTYSDVFSKLVLIKSPLHYTAIADLAVTHNIDVFALTETWISPNTTYAQQFDPIPHGFTLIFIPRLVTDLCTPQSLVVAQNLFSVNIANFSPHLQLLSNPLNCLQS